ncbi:MAG: VCBS repeat-containing protein, partial [Myxococcota bacterium]|nr:VCBS repeat-containing protein [Myxococcota bacterium]
MLWLISVLLVGCSGHSTNIDSAPRDTSSDEPVLDEGISLGEIQACEAPLATVSYTEVGEDMGLSGSSDPDGDHVDGGSAVVHDLDGDGDLDIVLAYGDGPPSVYWRKGSNFDREQLWFPPQSFAMSLLDANQDGLMDIAVGSSHPVLLLNEGSEFETLYLPTEGAHTVRELAPGELNGDGIPDLFAVTTSPTGEPGEMTDFVMLGVGD